MKKKIAISIIIVFFIISIIFGAIFIINSETKGIVQVEDGYTRYEWIQLLSEKFGMIEYISEEPYTTDVKKDNDYFSYVQSACEWGIIEKYTDFKGDEFVTGQYVALTAMKAVGQYKIQIYLEETDTLSNDDYIELALEKDVITSSQLQKYLTKEECYFILEQVSNFHSSALWKDDVCNIEYKDNVRELLSKDIIAINEDYSQIQVSEESASYLKKNDIIVVEHPMTGQKIAKKVSDISASGLLYVTEIELNQVINSLLISDVTSVSTNDILASYSFDEHTLMSHNNVIPTLANSNDFGIVPVWDESINKHDKGFSISLETEENTLYAKFHDNNTGLGFSLPIQEIIAQNEDVSVTLDVSRIDVGAQVIYTFADQLVYATAQVESDITVSGEVSINAEKKIPLFTTPIYFGNGVIGVELKFYLVLSVDGSISIETELPFSLSIDYVKDVGVRSHRANYSFKEPYVVANCTADCLVSAEAIIDLLSFDLFKATGDIGATVSADLFMRQHSDVMSCADLSIAVPILNISVSWGDDIESIMNNFIDISVEWNILTSENTLIRKNMHYEWYTNKKASFVKECTYKEKIIESYIDHTWNEYYAVFTSSIADKGDYYTVTGKLYCRDYIPIKVVENMEAGGIYILYGTKLVYEGKVPLKEFFNNSPNSSTSSSFNGKEITDVYTFSDNEGRKYWGYVLPVTPEDYIDNIPLFYEEKNEQGYSVSHESISIMDEEYTFKIKKNGSVNLYSKQEADGFTSIDLIGTYTAEECMKKSFSDYEGNVFNLNKAVPVPIRFDYDEYVSYLQTPHYLWNDEFELEEWVTH